MSFQLILFFQYFLFAKLAYTKVRYHFLLLLHTLNNVNSFFNYPNPWFYFSINTMNNNNQIFIYTYIQNTINF